MKKIFKCILLGLIISICGCKNYKGNEKLYKDDLKVYFINVGQADCTLIILPTEEVVLIDAGLDHATCYDSTVNFPSWENIKKIFDIEMIQTINYFIITHNHADHYYFASKIINEYIVNTVVMSGSTSTNYTYYNILNSINSRNVDTKIVKIKDYIINQKQLFLQVVSTKKEDNPSDANSCSVATKLTYNKISFMFTGDMGYNDGEIEALNSGIDLKSNVLKVGHHGSTYSSGRDFLRAVKPDYSVITTSNYTTTGHPHTASLNRLEYYSKKIFQSKTDGTILFQSNGIELSYVTHYGE